jgi:PilZ domain-containing protein
MSLPKGSATADRRLSARQLVTYRLDVVSPDGGAGCLLDISGSGMRVRFKAGLDVGSIQRLRIELPRWLELGAGLELVGRFVWMRAMSGGATEAGFAFDGLSRKESGLLGVLIQRLTEALAEDASGVG